ncbi:MAG: Hsp33 family molecular chaperone [Alphaproteobacteria bacterium]
MTEAAVPARDDNIVVPFQLESQRVRGRLVRLGSVADDILKRHDYPAPVGELLGETLALTTLLASALKYDGIFTLQTKSDGPVRLLVADVTSDGNLRGYAQVDRERIAQIMSGPPESPVARLLGAGYLAFTVDQGQHAERYQGIVELIGARLADCAAHYFRQSEQLETSIVLAAGRTSDGAPGAGGVWRASGLMLQRMPKAQNDFDAGWDIDADKDEDDWRRANAFLASVRGSELLDANLSADRLLFRLFHEDGVRVFERRPVVDRCRCSRDRAEGALRMLTAQELVEMTIDDKIVVTCQFCSRDQVFDEADLKAIEASRAKN